MPSHQRRRMEPTEDWQQLRFRFTWPEQASYELIRPVVLFGQGSGWRGATASVCHLQCKSVDPQLWRGLQDHWLPGLAPIPLVWIRGNTCAHTQGERTIRRRTGK